MVVTQPSEDLTDSEFDRYDEDDAQYGDDLMRCRRPERYQHAFLAVSHETVGEVLNDADVFSKRSLFLTGPGVTFGQTLSVMDSRPCQRHVVFDV